MTIARVPALLLLVAAGVLAMVQPANAATPQPDVAYLSTAHQLNLTIIEAARTATAKGRTSCVRRVAAQLERDHRKLSAQELDVATRLSIPLPTAPTTAQRRQLDVLAAKAGTTAYDGAWLALQRQAQQQYLALVEGELPISASPAVEALAGGAKPVIQMHQRAVSGTCRVETNTPVVPTGDGGQQAEANLARTRAALILMGIGVVLLLVGKSISLKRRVVGIAALAAGLVMMFGGQPSNTGKVPDAGKSSTDREAAVPPVRLKLPGVLEASVLPVAIGGNGQLEVPKSSADVGWWAAGAAPGAVGGTVLLAGHLDTAKGRGVFAALSEVPVGTKVAVTGGDGGEHWYRIVARRTYKQEALPADLFHGAAKPRLALVTCTGSYDRKARRYSENLVLYGVPLD